MDTTPLPLEQDLLRHRDFVLRLAARLVGRDDADDLAQDVWLRALEHPRTGSPGARGWLAHVARNLATSRFRARSRRARRERDAARPEGEPLSEVDERFELAQRVSAAVRALDEPYREVVLLRFFEGLSHAEIAARTGAPVPTVRTRQQRALARLRERLDREHGGRDAWSVALSAWVAANAPATGAAGAFGVTGALAAAAVILVLATGAWTLARGGEGSPDATPAPLAAAIPAPAPAAADVPPPANPAPRRALEAGATAPAPAARHVAHGRVVGLDADELRAASISVAGAWTRYVVEAQPVTAELRDDGTFEVAVDSVLDASPGLFPEELVATLEHPLHLRSEVRVRFEHGAVGADATTRHDCGALAAELAASLRGTVTLPGGAPADGATVDAFLLEDGVPREFPAATARCDARGRYDVRVGQPGEYAVVALVDGVRPDHVVATARLGRECELAAIELEAGVTLAGRGLRRGVPMPGATVYAYRTVRGSELHSSLGARTTWIDGRCEWTTLRLETDANGRFEYGGLAAGELDLHLTGADTVLGFRRRTTRVALPCAAVEIEADGSFVTLARSPDLPAVSGNVGVRRPGESTLSLRFPAHVQELTIEAEPGSPLALVVELDGLAPVSLELVAPAAGEELRHVLVHGAPAQLATLELEWAGDPRLVLDALRVSFETPDGRPILERSFHASDAPERVFRCDDVPPGRHRVRVRAAWDHLSLTPALDRVLEVELRPGEARRERLEFELGGQLSIQARDLAGAAREAQFRLLDARGAPVALVLHAKRDNTTMLGSWNLTPWGPNVSEALPVGEYELVLWDDDVAEQRIPVRIEPGETFVVDVALQPK